MWALMIRREIYVKKKDDAWDLDAMVHWFFLSACGGKTAGVRKAETMGTYYSIKYVPSSDSPSQSVLQTEIDRILEEVNDQMSTYRPQSELSRFNQSREINTPFPVSPATAKSR
ncbi:thiamine biosynthesis lipoprotein [Proteus mirabilis]|uniref:FAD:protein FMN transferase n=1 Tax=Proteus mirabilis TaxID=584 RepID=A0A2X2C7N8_PROMI|nr:thiamine biosynthesis lipoprotein [Proteus mirabilis]